MSIRPSGSSGGVTPGAWTAFPLANGWVDYNDAHSADGYGSPQYRINGDMVELRGVLDGSGASGHLAAVAAPARPTKKRRIGFYKSGATEAIAHDMDPSGVIMAPNGTAAAGAFFILDGGRYSL